jgi:hypothetical protein
MRAVAEKTKKTVADLDRLDKAIQTKVAPAYEDFRNLFEEFKTLLHQQSSFEEPGLLAGLEGMVPILVQVTVCV